MTRTQKAEVIENLTTAFGSCEAIAICDYKGLTVKQLEELRNAIREVGGKTQVVKNTLANIALKNANKEGYNLSDTNIVMWAEDQLTLAKAVVKFSEANKDLFNIRKAFMDGEFKESSDLVTLSKLPGREELLGMLLNVWQAPIRMFVTGMDNLAQKNAEETAA